MGVFGSFVANLFASLIAWFAKYLGERVAVGAAAVTAMSAMTAALYVGIRAVLAGLSSQAVGLPEFASMMLGLAIPPVAPACISSYMTAWGLCTVYAWKRQALSAFRGV